MPERVPPHSIPAETSVLGALLIDPEAMLRVASMLQPSDFYRDAHRIIYAAALRIHKRNAGVDFITLTEELSNHNELADVGDEAYVAGLANVVPTSVHAEYYASIVHEKATRRRAISAGNEVLALAYDTSTEIDHMLDGVHRAVSRLSERGMRSTVSFADSVSSVYLELLGSTNGQSTHRGIPYGYHELDQVTDGMTRSDLIIIAGRPSTGKTTLALNIMRNLSFGASRIPTALFSMESNAAEISKRFLSMVAEVPTPHMTNPNDQDSDRMAAAMGLLTEAPVVVEEATMNMRQMYDAAKLLHEQHNIGLIIIDYLQLISGHSKNGNRVQEMSDISRNLKGMARELNIPIIALSQLNRSVEHREDAMPKLSDLRDSGSLEQDADVVIFLKQNREDTSPTRDVEIGIGKNRNGPLGTFPLRFHASEFRFEDVGYGD